MRVVGPKFEDFSSAIQLGTEATCVREPNPLGVERNSVKHFRLLCESGPNTQRSIHKHCDYEDV